jgi:hypothetical protein
VKQRRVTETSINSIFIGADLSACVPLGATTADAIPGEQARPPMADASHRRPSAVVRVRPRCRIDFSERNGARKAKPPDKDLFTLLLFSFLVS